MSVIGMVRIFLLLLFMYVNGPVFVLGVLGEVSSFILYGSCLP